MKRLLIVVGLTVVGSGWAPPARATDEAFPGGWCSFKLNGLDPTSPQDYVFDPVLGVLTIKNDGFWQIFYQDRAGFGNPNAILVDIPGVLSEFNLGGSDISVDLRGKSVIGTIDLDSINANNNRDLRLILTNGGSVNALVSATTYRLANSTIAGHVLSSGTIAVKSILDIASGIELDIAGNLIGTVTTLNDIGSPTIDSRIHIDGVIQSSGKIEIGGTLYGTIDIDFAFSGLIDAAANVDGDIYIGGQSSGTIDIAGNLNGLIDATGVSFTSIFVGDGASGGFVNGDIAFHDWFGGNLIVTNDFTGNFDVSGDLESFVDIEVGGDISGTFDISGNWDATLQSGQLNALSGTIHVGGSVLGGFTLGDVSGSIVVDGAIGDKFPGFSEVVCDDLTGTITVGAVERFGQCISQNFQTGAAITVSGDIAGIVTSHQSFYGTLSCANVAATGQIFGSGEGFHGSIIVTNEMAGLIFATSSEVGGDISCNSLSGSIRAWLDITGDIDISGPVQAGGTILCGRHMTGTISVGSDMRGTIDVAENLSGSVHVFGDVVGTVGSVDDGHIIVNGSLKSSATITIDGQFVNGTEFIAVDYDGYDAADTWEDGATVSVDGDVYEGNSPSARVWEITQQLGDMNNDGPINGGDIDPFFLGLGNPAAYGVAFPGLAGSRVHHGDCNEDTFFNAADIDPFFELLGGGGGGFNFMTPEHIAWLIETNVRPDRLERAILLVAEYVNVWATGERRAFWREVLELLRPS